MENLLKELKEITESVPVKLEKEKRERLEKERELDFVMIHEITEKLISKLKETANRGERKYTVLEASVFGNYSKRDLRYHHYDYGKCWDRFGEIYSKASDYHLCHDKEFLKKVIEQSQGVFKAVYKYCNDLKLNPIVRQFEDGVGDDGGFGIYIEW